MLAQHASTWEIYNPPRPQGHAVGPRGKGKAQQMLLPVHHFSPQGKMPRAMPPRGIPVSLRGFLYLLVPGGERDREGGSVLEGYFPPLPSSQRRHRPSGRMVVPLSRVLIHARKRAERAPCPRTYQRRGIIIVSQTSHPKLQVHILPPLFPSITEKAPPGLSNGRRRYPRAGGEVKFGTASLHCYRSMPSVSSKETSGRRHDTPVEVFHLSVRRVSPQLAYFLR